MPFIFLPPFAFYGVRGCGASFIVDMKKHLAMAKTSEPNHPVAANPATAVSCHAGRPGRVVAGRDRWATKSVMKRVAAVLLLVSAFCAHAAEGGITNLVVTPSEVDPKSVTLTGAESPQPNVNFNFLSKTPEQVRAIYRTHAAVLVVKDGVVVAKAAACSGRKDHIGPDGHVDFAGLVLIFDDLDQARIAERILKREDKKPK